MRKKKEAKGERIQYHQAFCVSMENELLEDRDNMRCMSEVVLNTMPNKIDMMIVKEADVEPGSGIGNIFRRYNLVEYKSPEDELNISTYNRSIAYMFLYHVYKVGNVYLEPDEYSLTFVRERKPKKLMKLLGEKNYSINEYEPGIYHIIRPGYVDMQIIVTIELEDRYIWLKCLSDKVTREQAEQLTDRINIMEGKDRIRAESVLDLMIRLNADKEWMKEVTGMGAFRDLFKAEFEEKDRKIEENERKIEEKDHRIQENEHKIEELSRQLQSQEKLQSQIEEERKENSRLREEIERLKKLNRIAMF